jgi:16S rRNA (guanine(527)-N(7))-methyltransferase RsmG
MVEADDAVRALDALDLPTSSHAQILAYLRTLDAWAGRINLTGARTAAERLRLLVADVLPVAPHLLPGRVLDIGSGNGSPGLVLAALRPDLPMTLLEPRQRRWAFLREAARAMGRADIEALRLRHDEYRGPGATNVVVRAVALPLRELASLTDRAGQAIVIGHRADPQGSGFAAAEDIGPSIHRYRRCST